MGEQNPKNQKEKLELEKTEKEEGEKFREREQKEGGIQQEGVRKRTGTKLEMLESTNLYAPDTKTAQTINGMEVEKMESEKEIQSSLELLGTVSVPILAKMFENGFKQDEIHTLDEFKVALDRIDREEKFAKLKEKISNLTEKATFTKLREILYKPSSKIYKKLEEKWTEYIKKSKEVINDASKGTASKAWEYVKKNPGEAVLLVAGAYGLYALFKSFKSDEEKPNGKDKKEWTDRIFSKKTGLATIGILTIGALLGGNKLLDFIKGKLFGDTKEIALHAVQKAKEAAINALNKRINFDETKNRLLKLMPSKPEWLKTAKLQQILEDMGIDPEKTGHLEKYSGPGGAALLLKDWMTRKNRLDGATQKILGKFLEKEQGNKPESASANKEAIEKEYGEMAPIKEALPEFGTAIAKQLYPVYEFVKKNPELFAASSLFLFSFSQVRDVVGSGLKGGFHGFVGLAKVPFKAIKEFPLSSLFVLSAALLAEDQLHVTDKLGNILVPKDPENLKKYLRKKMEQAGTWIEGLPHVPEPHIDKAVEIMKKPSLLQEYVGPAKEMIENVGLGFTEMMTLQPKEVIQKANNKGLTLFAMNLKNLQLDAPEESEKHEQFNIIIKKVKELQLQFHEGKSLEKKEFISTLQKLAEPLHIKIFDLDGYIAYTYLTNEDGIPITKGPRNILIDPSLNQDIAIEKAQSFVIEDTWEDSLNKPFEIPVNQLRMHLDRILFKDIESEKDAKKIVERKLNGGATIVMYGGAAFLYEATAGVMHRYALGPYHVAKHLVMGLTGNFSYKEAAVDYANGILPVFILGTATSLAKGEFLKNMFSGRLLLESVAYPIKGMIDLKNFTFGHITPNLRQERPLHAITVEPGLKVNAQFWEKANSLQHRWAEYSKMPYRLTLRSEYMDLSKLYAAKRYLHEANHSPREVKTLHEKAQGALEGIGLLEGKTLREDNAQEFLKDIEAQIKERESILKKFKQYKKYNDALKHIEDGKTDRAKKILDKLGYEGPITENAIKQKIQNERQGIIQERPQARFEDLTPAEKITLTETLKESKADIEKLALEGEEAIKSEMKKATDAGKPLADLEVQKKIDLVRTEYDQKFVALFESKGLHNIDLLDDAAIKKAGLDPKVVREKLPHLEAKVKPHGNIKRVGKGVLGFAALLLAMYGISKGVEWFHSEERGFKFESAENSATPEEKKTSDESKKKMKDSPEHHEKIVKQIEFYFSALEKDYMPLNELLGNPKKLNETSDDQLKKLVDEGSTKHKANIENLKDFVATNKEAILLYYERLPKAKEGKDRGVGQFFSIGFDAGDNRPYLKYADESDFRDTYYEIVDIYRAHMEQLLKGEPLTGWDTAIHAGSYAVPVYGTYLDGRDSVRAIGRGEWASAAKSGGWCVLGAVSDVLMVAGVVSFGTTTVAGGALKAVRVGGAGAKGVAKGTRAFAVLEKVDKAMTVLRESKKIATAAKYSHIAMTAGVAVDIGRQVFIPPKSQTYYF